MRGGISRWVWLIVFSALVGGAAAWAEDPSSAPQGDWAQAKQEHVKGIDARISGLQKLKGCLEGAASKDAMQKCHTDHRNEMMDSRSEMREHRWEMRKEHKMERMNKRIERLEEKKKALENSGAATPPGGN